MTMRASRWRTRPIARSASGGPIGPLHGLPTAFKDLEPAVGFPQTKGSPIYKDLMPDADSVIVERMRRAGAIPIGKTNVPEFGMGSQTYNTVYGTTRQSVRSHQDRRWIERRRRGGAWLPACCRLPMAATLAARFAIPRISTTSWRCGRRVGLVPVAPTPIPFVGVSTKGAMARSVSDVAFGLSVVAGADARDPQSFASNPQSFAGPLERDWRGVRVAWSPDLGGLPLDRARPHVLEAQRKTFEDLGCIVEDACPGLRRRQRDFPDAANVGELEHLQGPARRASLADQGRRDLGHRVRREADRRRGGTRADSTGRSCSSGCAHSSEKYEFLICAVNQVPPFDATEPWPKSIDGVAMENYVAWMKTAYWISTTCRPAISVPAGFTDEGLPVGVQIVGRYRDDLNVLKIAHAFEQATGFGKRRPPDV